MHCLDFLEKKSAGKSFRQPIHGKLFFCDQDSVDEFVNNLQTIKISTKVAQILFQCQIFSYLYNI